MKVADFFCGAGGFSEGFRQMGFDVVFALDNWKPAVDTHDLNHPKCKCVQMDILELDTPEKIDEVVPDVDVIIGSPPCVAFSGSNKAGKADKSLGIRLIEAYLRIIAWKRKKGVLKYWILENVPNSGNYIKDEYTWEELGLPGKGPKLTIKQKNVLNAAEYGAPQGRKRFVCGDYPLPEKTHDEKKMVTMAHVLRCLGNPSQDKSKKINDPVYPISIISNKLTDHFYDTRISEPEWKRAKRLKVDHGYMGKMSFPEYLDRPSRTVMATMSASTREAIIFDSYDKEGKQDGYRLPTIREIACFMSFPITYQFEAGSEGAKYRLVGNAVCAKLSAALASAILKDSGLEIPKEFLSLPDTMPSVNLNGSARRIKVPAPKMEDAKFSIHIPNLRIRSFRVELDNKESDFKNKSIVWNSSLHYGSGKAARRCKVDNANVKPILQSYKQFPKFEKELGKTFDKEIKANDLHESYRLHGKHNIIEPSRALEIMKDVVDKHFKEEEFKDKSAGTNSLEIGRDSVPVRVLAGLYACNYFVSTIR